MRASLLLLTWAGVVIAGEGFLKLDLQTSSRPRLRKRQTNTDDLNQKLVLSQDKNFYWLNITIGTPPQAVGLDIDTGSSDLVVINSNVSRCSDPAACGGGTFDPSKSSTYEVIVANGSDNAYGDHTEYIGDLFTDVLSVGGINIEKGAMIGNAASSLIDAPNLNNSGVGLIGIGFQALSSQSAAFEQAKGELPPTVVSAMVASGDIARQAYSLELGSTEAAQGSVIFGGVDPGLYTGDLVTLPLVPAPNSYANYTAFLVALTGISVTDLEGTRMLTDDSFGVPALLDSGTTLTDLPSSVVTALNNGFGVSGATSTSYGYLPCSRAKANVSITYHFGGTGGPSITIPLSSLMDPPASGSSQQYTFDDGEFACNFNIEPESDGNGVILGDSFMRSTYFVYDLENAQVAMAQAASSPSSGSITAIPSGTDIPGCSSTNTFTLPASEISSDVPDVSNADTATETPTGSILPATATFDLGAVTTETANPTGGSGGSSSSSSSSGGAARPTGMIVGGALDKMGLLAAAIVGGVAVL